MGSKNSPDSLVAGAGWGAHLIIGIVEGLRAHKWDNERIHGLVTTSGKMFLERGIEGFISALNTPPALMIDRLTGTVCAFMVDYDTPIDEMVAAGEYGVVDPLTASSNFPILYSGIHKVHTKLFAFNNAKTDDEARMEIEVTGYRVANIAELLTFGAYFPEVQLQFPVLALTQGKDFGGRKVFAYLGKDFNGRRIFVAEPLNCYRREGWRYLAVRK